MISSAAEAIAPEFSPEELGLDYAEPETDTRPHLVLIYGGESDELLGFQVDDEDEHEDEPVSGANLNSAGGQLDKIEQLRLIAQARAGDQAATQRLVEANLGLVKKLASTYTIKGMEFDDIVHEGVFGLYRAIEKHDASRGSFSFVARYYIKEAIFQSLYKTSRLVRIPASHFRDWSALARVEDDLTQAKQRFPTLSELVEATGWEANKVVEIRSGSHDAISLNAQVGQTELTIQDTVAAEVIQPLDALLAAEQRRSIRRAVGCLPTRESTVLQGYFGFNELNLERTLEEISRPLGVTRTRVGQIKGDAIKRISPKLAELDVDF